MIYYYTIYSYFCSIRIGAENLSRIHLSEELRRFCCRLCQLPLPLNSIIISRTGYLRCESNFYLSTSAIIYLHVKHAAEQNPVPVFKTLFERHPMGALTGKLSVR